MVPGAASCSTPRVHARAFGESYAYEFVRAERCVGELWWHYDASCRGTVGWYVRDFREPWRVRRLDLDPAVASLASEYHLSEARWLEEADAQADHTADLALVRAETLLREGRSTSGTPRADFEIHVTGLSLATALASFPALTTHDVPGGLVLCGRLSKATLVVTLRAIRTSGGCVAAVFELDGNGSARRSWLA
jgi:hypothetical protein